MSETLSALRRAANKARKFPFAPALHQDYIRTIVLHQSAIVLCYLTACPASIAMLVEFLLFGGVDES